MIEKIIKTAPWKLSKSGNPNFNECIVAKDGGSVCHLTSWSSSEVDKKVIETAPEMLEGLIEQIDFLNDIIDCFDDFGLGYRMQSSIEKRDSLILIIKKATNKSWGEIKELIK